MQINGSGERKAKAQLMNFELNNLSCLGQTGKRQYAEMLANPFNGQVIVTVGSGRIQLCYSRTMGGDGTESGPETKNCQHKWMKLSDRDLNKCLLWQVCVRHLHAYRFSPPATKFVETNAKRKKVVYHVHPGLSLAVIRLLILIQSLICQTS